MPKATHKLENLSIEEGSLVGAGDNPEAHIRLFKTKPDDVDAPSPWSRFRAWMLGEPVEARKDLGDPMTTSQILAADAFADQIGRVRCAFTQSIWGILSLGDPAKMAPLLQRSVDEFASESQQLVDDMGKRDPASAEKLRALFDEVAARAVAACKAADIAADDSPERHAFAKACADLEAFAPATPSTEQEGTMPANEKAKSVDEILAALPETDRATIKAQLEQANKSAPAAPPAAPPPVEKTAAEVALEKRLADAEKKAADAEAAVAKIEDERRLQTFVGKAKGLGLPEPEKIGLALKNAYARSDDDGKALEQVLTATAEQVKAAQSSLTKPVGSAAVVTKGSPLDQLNQKADELRKSDPKLSFASAFAKAAQDNPGLYDQMSREASADA